MTIDQPDRARDPQVLDPCLLGRPVHLLPLFASRFGEALGAAMAAPDGRRYWGAYRLASLAFERAPAVDGLRWLGVDGVHGVAAVAFERRLLLDLLEGRYARRTTATGAAVQRDPETQRVTATEERLAATLAQQLAALLDAQVGAPRHAARVGTAVPVAAPGKTGWAIRVVLRAQYGRRETDAPGLATPDGQLWIALDHALMTQVLQGLQPERGGARGARMRREPLASTLRVKLDGRLVSKQVTLAELFDLKVGDVIPVSVGRADVLLDEARLFTAAVAENKGKLCLTSFEDAE